MLRPRTNQVVGIIDELLGQFNRDNTFSPSPAVPYPSRVPYNVDPTGSSLRTFNKGLTQFNIDQTPTPLMPATMRSQREQFRPPVNLGDTSAVAPGVPAEAQVAQVNPQPVTAQRQVTPEEYVGNMPRIPGSDMQMRDLAQKAEQARQIEASNPELKTDPTFQDRIKGFFGDRENMLRLALGFNTMRLSPDQGLATAIQSELKDLRTQNRATNVAARLRQLGTPEAIRAAEYIESTSDVKGGMTMYNKAGSVVQKTGVELGGEAAGYDPKKIYNVDKITGKVSSIGGGDTTVTVEGAKKDLFERYYKYVADNRDAFIEAGKAANTRLGAYGRMNRALDFTATGKEESNRQAIRTMLDGLGLSGLIDEQAYANAAAFNAAANQLVAEELRANKGPQTDFDAQFAQTYIPNLSSPKDANREILKYGQSTAQIQRILGQLANRVDANSETVLQDMAEVNEFALTVPNVVIKADGTVMHFYDYYSNNRKADIKDLMQAWILFADRERERQLSQ